MSPGKVLVLNIVFAIATTAIFMGPACLILWFSWRSLLAAAFVLAAIPIALFTVFAAMSAVSSHVDRAVGMLATGLLIVAVLILGAATVFLVRNNFVVRSGATVLGMTALLWLWTGHQHILNAWEFIGSSEDIYSEFLHPGPKRSSEASAQAMADRGVQQVLEKRAIEAANAGPSESAPPTHASPDTVLPLRDLHNQVHQIALTPNCDIVTLDERGKSSAAFLKLIRDPQMARWLKDRDVIAVIGYDADSKLASAKGVVPMLFSLEHQYYPLMTPGFYHTASGTFSTGVYRWMRDVLEIPQVERDELYLRYHDVLPN